MVLAVTDTGLAVVDVLWTPLLGEERLCAMEAGVEVAASFGDAALRIDPDALIMWSRRLLHL